MIYQLARDKLICIATDSTLSQIVSTNTQTSVKSSTKFFIDTANITLTLDYGDSENLSIVEVYAFENCQLTYYTSQNNIENYNMGANTKLTFVFYNGWHRIGMYDAVWS